LFYRKVVADGPVESQGEEEKAIDNEGHDAVPECKLRKKGGERNLREETRQRKGGYGDSLLRRDMPGEHPNCRKRERKERTSKSLKGGPLDNSTCCPVRRSTRHLQNDWVTKRVGIAT